MGKRLYRFIAVLAVTALMLSDLEPLGYLGKFFKSSEEILSENAAAVLEELSLSSVEAEAATGYSFLIGSAQINDGGEINYTNYRNSQRTLKIILKSEEGVASGTAITWTPSNENIVKVLEQNDNELSVTLDILSPGFSGLSVSLNIDGLVLSAVAYCSIHVPLEWSDDETGNQNILASSSDPYGLMVAQTGESTDNYTLQLYTSESTDHPNSYHYLRKLRYVSYEFKTGTADNYATGGVTPTSVPSNIEAEDLVTPSTTLTWESSDTSIVEVDSASGLITAKSAGFARVTCSTNTINERLGTGESISFNVVVVPDAYVSGYTTDYLNRFLVTTDPAQADIVIQTNAKFATNLSWNLFQGDAAVTKKDITSKYKDNIEIGEANGRVVLSDLPAGVYYLTAIAVKDSTASRTLATYGVTDANIQYLGITIIVPIKFPTSEIILNYYNASVYDTYDLKGNSNLPDSTFRFTSADTTVAKVGTNDGVVEATGIGETNVIISKINDKVIKNIFGDYASDPSKIGYDGSDYYVHVTVVHGVSISSTTETMPLGSTLQLNLTAPNPYEGDITWTSSNEKIVTVDETGFVTAVGVGDAKVTVKIKVAGVTKRATCKIKVVSAVDTISLSAKNDYVLVGDNLTISATVSPKLANASLIWAVSDESVASIADTADLSMTITGVAAGSVVVTAVNQDNAIVATKVIKVIQDITSLSLSDTEVVLPQTTGFYQLYAYCTPALPENQSLTWTSSNKKVVTVDSNGKVTLVKPGTAVITVSTENGLLAQCNFTVTQGVESINFDESEITLYVGEKYRLTYVIKPNNATTVDLKWDVYDSKIATIDASGYVTAKNVGTTIVMAKATDGSGVMAMCSVTVKRSATALKLDVSELDMAVGDVYQLEATLTPADSSDTITYESSNTKVVTVTAKGKITAKGKGNCVVLARTDGQAAPQYVNITVTQPMTGLTLSTKDATIYVDEELELEAVIQPKNVSDKEVTFSSDDESVATVDKNGKVKGVTGGIALIWVTSADGDFKDYCKVTVLEQVTEITLVEEAEVGVGKKLKLTATINNETATNKNVTWKSSNKKIAKVNAKGVVTGVKEGTCIITVTAADGSGTSAECELTVITSTESITIDPSMTYLEMIVGDQKQIKFATDPTPTTYSPVWSAADSDIAFVNQQGIVTALKAGTTTITVAAGDNPDITGIVIVKVTNPVNATSITFDKTELVMIPGETNTIVASFQPGNITESYTWSSDNPTVASIDSNGRVTAKQVGTANITLMTRNSGKKATVKVYVVGLSETSVTLYQYEKLLLGLEVDGQSGDLDVRWGTKNQNIAVVSSSGKKANVTAKATGTTNVYVSVNGRELYCKVKVIKNLK